MKRIILMLFVVMTTYVATAAEKKECCEETTKSGVISLADGKYTLSVGGYVHMRAAYDFGGVVNHPDFVPALISMGDDSYGDSRFYMDATTSRFEVKGSTQSEKFGDVELCLNMDFRGGSIGSYTPRLRLAYVSAGGFLVGRAYTTFADMGVATPNIDFEGPVVCPYIYATQIRYVHSFAKDDKWQVGAALEYTGYESSTLGDNFAYQEQYLPTIPAYLQFSWGEKQSSHLRLTGLYKNISLYDIDNGCDVSLNGWGAQLSGSLAAGSRFELYYSATCGEGITDQMQDTYGSGLDAVVSGDNMILTPMYGWQVVASLQATERTLVTAGYSTVSVCGNESRFAADDYRNTDYVSASLFYSLTSRVQLAAEYLWGARTNVDGARGTANRINTMVQYNF